MSADPKSALTEVLGIHRRTGQPIGAADLIRDHGEELQALVQDGIRWREREATWEASRNASHICLRCCHPYTPKPGESEDCPVCGHDGSGVA